MAGIGFTLKRVISRGDVTSFALGSLGGVFIVAGPSILSMFSLWLVTGPLSSVEPSAMGPFTATLIYALMTSTILSAGLQYTFTRSVADALHRGQEGQAAGALLKLLAWLAPLSFAFGFAAAWPLSLFPGAPNWLESAALGLLSMTATCMWMLVLFSSMLHRYLRVLVLYALGLGAAVFLSGPLAAKVGSAGLCLAFGGAYLILDLGLLALIVTERRPEKPAAFEAPRILARRYPALLAYGFAYQGALWADKLLTWFLRGRPEPGTSLFLAAEVDSVAYLASLSLIPGLVFFIVASETDYFAALRRFLNALTKRPYRVIRSALHELQRHARRAVVRLAVFQASVTLAVILARPIIAPGAEATAFTLYAAGALFQLVALCAQNFLFYLEAYEQAFLGALAFLAGNALATAMGLLFIANWPAGAGYLLGAALSAWVSSASLARTLRGLDRFLYTKRDVAT